MTTGDLLSWIEDRRTEAVPALDAERQRTFAQFFTPTRIAQVMASMLRPRGRTYRLLDPGAGIGVLSAVATAALLNSSNRPRRIHLTCYELDDALGQRLAQVLDKAAETARAEKVSLTYEIRFTDFISDACTRMLSENEAYDGAILNPPYGKIRSNSASRELMRALHVEVPNLYAAFWAAAISLTAKRGDVVAITPRSFCNGTYFRDFRRFLLDAGALRRIHVFDSRDKAFADQEVLQENVITHLSRGSRPGPVELTAQSRPEAPMRSRTVSYTRVVKRGDPDRFIHIVPDPSSDTAAAFMSRLRSRLDDLGVDASTGPVVDFRATNLLRHEPDQGTIPLIYPAHIRAGVVQWQAKGGKRSMLIVEREAKAKNLLVPDGHYVITKRFTAKEEPRRVVAALYDGDPSSGHGVAIENHLNYLHAKREPLPRTIAIGLVVYLNSSHVDDYLRQFSGHTQVNAGDLRSLRYPSRRTLAQIGGRADLARIADPDYFDEIKSASTALGTAQEIDPPPRAVH